MELVNEWFPTGKIINVDTSFRTDTTYENKLMVAFPLTENALHKSEMEYHGKFGHALGRIRHISLMSRIGICYATCRLENQTVAPTLPGFQGIKRCVQYLASHPHKPIFYPSNSYDGSNFSNTAYILIILIMAQILSDLHGVGIKLKTAQPRIV